MKNGATFALVLELFTSCLSPGAVLPVVLVTEKHVKPDVGRG